MFARVSTYDVPGERAEDAIRGFRDAIDRIRASDGFLEAFFLVDRDGNQAMTITLWESAHAMEASRVAASRARTEAARAADGEVRSSSEFVVAIHETGKPS
jgi:heme-degrading monooxygenase HmoA